MISAKDLESWTGGGSVDLASLDGGERLNLRFVTFLAVQHPDVLKRFLESEKARLFEKEQLLAKALSEVTGSRLSDAVAEGEQWELLAEWAGMDEDAYELVNLLRKE